MHPARSTVAWRSTARRDDGATDRGADCRQRAGGADVGRRPGDACHGATADPHETRTAHAPRYAHHQFRPDPPNDLQALARVATVQTWPKQWAERRSSSKRCGKILIRSGALRRDLAACAEGDPDDQFLVDPSARLPPRSRIRAGFSTRTFSRRSGRGRWSSWSCGETRRGDGAVDRFQSLGLVTAVVRGDSKRFHHQSGLAGGEARIPAGRRRRLCRPGRRRPALDALRDTVRPFGIMDMVGLDVVADIETCIRRSHWTRLTPRQRSCTRKARRRSSRRKVGHGFYQHPEPEYTQLGWLTGDVETETQP